MTHKLTLFRSLALAVLSGALVFGCDDDDGDDVVLPDGQVVYTDLDTNGDGYIEIAEWDAYFGAWDLNDDGVITPNEWFLDEPFAEVDTNGDGEISQAEYDAAFNTLDTNADGYLDPNELLFQN